MIAAVAAAAAESVILKQREATSKELDIIHATYTAAST